MKKPVEYVCVLNQMYSVSLDEMDEYTSGECDTELKTIKLAHDLSEDQLKRVMLHELLHAFMFESGITQIITLDTEEMIAQSLSGFLNGVLNWKIKNGDGKTRH